MRIEFTVSGKNGTYTIQVSTTDTYPEGRDCVFLQNQDGEGMGMSEQNLFDVLDKHFKEVF